MGGCASKHDARHLEIEKELKKDRRAAELEMKLLLLGAGQSGKSTIAKQFKIIKIGNYEEAELMEYRVAIIENIFSAIKALVQGAEEKGIKIGEDVQASAARIAALNPTTALIQDYKDDIIKLWADKGIKEAFARSREFQLNDNAHYVLDAVHRVAAADYLPSQDDVLKTRVRTTGVMEINFPMDDFKVRLVDVGGQRAERRKWMGCFDDVTAVLFCVALSEYDQRLLEDDETNRTEESMKVFLDVTGKWFPKTTIILFLNKKDLFAEKVKTSPLKRTFPDYEGPDEYEPAAEFMRDKFIALDPNKEDNRIFPHFTCATDTDNIRVVFDAVSETLVKGNLKNAGLL